MMQPHDPFYTAPVVLIQSRSTYAVKQLTICPLLITSWEDFETETTCPSFVVAKREVVR